MNMLLIYFHLKSWSFGIVLWEIFSLCEHEPYRHIQNKDFRHHMEKLRDGTEQTELPVNGSDKIQAIMKACWTIDHKFRPTFQQLAPQLENLLDDDHKKVFKINTRSFL